MSNMANEIAARIAEDGGNLEGGVDNLGGAAEPGTGRPDPTPAAPPAEALNIETPPQGEEPGPVPYSRFKEVNEGYQKLRGYEALEQYGYDPDSLTRLANFEANYVQDPGSTVMVLVDNLDLPEDQKNQMREWLTSESGDGSASEGTPGTPPSSDAEEPPTWFKPYAERLKREDEARQQEAQRSAEERETQARQEALDAVVSQWDEMDKKAGIPSPREGIKLALIASHAASGQYATPQALAEGARAEWLAERESAVGSHFVSPGNGPGPRSVPSSAATPSPAQVFGGDIKKASAAAAAAMERGELPRIVSGG